MTLVPFFGVEIETGAGALIPRPETELLAAAALARLDGTSMPHAERPTMIDVCCGTGNLACALAARVPSLRVTALDLTDSCVALARANVMRLGLADRVTVLQGDLFAPVDVIVDLVVCNPPYISTGKLATRDDLAGEPREAFDGGPYGVTIHQRVAREAHRVLRPGGWLVCELGLGQEKQLQHVFARAGGYTTIEFINDPQGAPRVVAARRGEP